MIEMPLIDTEKCNGCGLCVDVCHTNSLVLIDNIIAIVATEECDWCAECEIVCLTGAITCPFEIVMENP